MLVCSKLMINSDKSNSDKNQEPILSHGGSSDYDTFRIVTEHADRFLVKEENRELTLEYQELLLQKRKILVESEQLVLQKKKEEFEHKKFLNKLKLEEIKLDIEKKRTDLDREKAKNEEEMKQSASKRTINNLSLLLKSVASIFLLSSGLYLTIKGDNLGPYIMGAGAGGVGIEVAKVLRNNSDHKDTKDEEGDN